MTQTILMEKGQPIPPVGEPIEVMGKDNRKVLVGHVAYVADEGKRFRVVCR